MDLRSSNTTLSMAPQNLHLAFSFRWSHGSVSDEVLLSPWEGEGEGEGWRKETLPISFLLFIADIGNENVSVFIVWACLAYLIGYIVAETPSNHRLVHFTWRQISSCILCTIITKYWTPTPTPTFVYHESTTLRSYYRYRGVLSVYFVRRNHEDSSCHSILR